MDERAERLRRVADDVGLDAAGVASAETRLSWSNDVWVLDHPLHGRCALRICTLGRRDRLLAEAMLGAEVPASVGYPRVLAYGTSAGFTWQLTAWMPGGTLAEAFGGLGPAQRERAGAVVGERLRALHAVRPGPATTRALLFPHGEDLIGESSLPLPLPRALTLLDRTTFDQDLRAEVAGLLSSGAALAPRFDDPALPVVHSDLHLFNIWWHDGAVRGLIDLEFARFGPQWVDLSRLACLWLEDELCGRDDYRPLISGVLSTYPELADVDHLDDRLRLCVVAWQVRQSLLWGGGEDEPDHPVRVLRRALSGPMLPQ